MPGGNLFRFFSFAREEIHRLIGPAIDGEMKLELIHAKIVFSAKFGKNFFNLSRFRITSGFGELNDRSLILERFH